MNTIDLSNLNGFPFGQKMAKFMQDASGDMFTALAKLIGDKVILSGVQVIGGNVTSGWISYNGEIIKFIGGAAGPDVVIVETTDDALFQDAVTRPVYKTRTATIGSPGEFAFADLKRLDTLIAFLLAFNDHITDYNAHSHSYASLTAKPAGRIVYIGAANVGNLPATDGTYTIVIPDQGGETYYVFVTWIGNDTDYNASNDFSWMVYDKLNTSFKIGVREYAAVAQNLRVEFIIVKAN